MEASLQNQSELNIIQEPHQKTSLTRRKKTKPKPNWSLGRDLPFLGKVTMKKRASYLLVHGPDEACNFGF